MYNRRGGRFGSPASSVGQRRQGNFVAGGQLKPNNQGGVQPPIKQQEQANVTKTPQKAPVAATVAKEEPKLNLQASAEQVIAQQKVQDAKAPVKKEVTPATPVKTPATPAKTPATPAKIPATPAKAPVAAATPTPSTPASSAPTPVPAPVPAPTPVPAPKTDTNGEAEEPMVVEPKVEEMEGVEDTTGKPTKPWMKKGKILKAEKIRRRNRRLKKVLLPKNALMVLNEIVGATSYEMTDMSQNKQWSDGMNFRATVSVDGKNHEGYGKNKPTAKTAAAEAALKHIVLTKMTAPEFDATAETSPMDVSVDEAGEEKEEKEDEGFSICHLASFALFKLFNSWDDTGKILSRSSSQSTLATSWSEVNKPEAAATKGVSPEIRPSKKMPEHPELMNPIMLLNQMFPHAEYEEVCRTGIPPKIVFTMKCTIESKSYIGHGQNKKVARREAAQQACQDILKVVYPPM